MALAAFWMGVVFGAISLVLLAFVAIGVEKNSCAKEHNVFTCEFVGQWVPMENPD